MDLYTMKQKLLNGGGISEKNKEIINSILKEPKRPLGKLNPWAWWVEVTRGCNLDCAFCATRLFPKDEMLFMEKNTWITVLKIIQEITQYSRL